MIATVGPRQPRPRSRRSNVLPIGRFRRLPDRFLAFLSDLLTPTGIGLPLA